MNPGIFFSHNFLYKGALTSKSVVSKGQKVLDETIKMVNYIKSWPLESRSFSVLYSVMEVAHTAATAHGSRVAIKRAGAFKVL